METEVISCARRKLKKIQLSTESNDYPRGTFVWAKFNKTYWPGIILNADDLNAVIQKNKYLIFCFGDNTTSQICKSSVLPYAASFKDCYRPKKGPLWKSAVEISILHYGSPYTDGMDTEALIKFALSPEITQIHKDIRNLPEFVQIKLDSKKLYQLEMKDRMKNLKLLKTTLLENVIHEVCVACYRKLPEDCIEHPIFEAYTCPHCSKKLRETLNQITEKGKYEYCFICGNASRFQCLKPTCLATFCSTCIKNLWHLKPKSNLTFCILCSSIFKSIIPLSTNYRMKISAFLITPVEELYKENPIVPSSLPLIMLTSTRLIKVLSLFYGSSISLQQVFPIPLSFLIANASNNLSARTNLASSAKTKIQQLYRYFDNSFVQIVSANVHRKMEISSTCMHIEDINRRRSLENSDICLILGGTSIPSTQMAHFRRSKFTDMFMEFWRIVELYEDATQNEIKWIFEMPYSVTFDQINYVKRFLTTDPILIEDTMGNFSVVWCNFQFST